MDFFERTDCRDIIKSSAEGSGITSKSIAAAVQIHSSYFSRVMQGKADFSGDQLFKIGKVLKLNDDKMDYVLALGEKSRSSHHNYEGYCEDKIHKLRRKHLKVAGRLKKVDTNLSSELTSTYYEQAITAKIHMFLTIAKYRNNPSLIAKKLFISDSKLASEINKLVELGLVESDPEKGVRVVKPSIHLDESHPISVENHKNWRLETISQLTRRESQPSDYHLSAVFSCDEETKALIREKIQKLIVDVQGLISASKESEGPYHLMLDLY